MKRVKAKPITELILPFLRAEGLETPLLEYRITHRGWNELMGSVIAMHTRNIYIYNQVLYLECDSPVVRQELSLRKSEIVYKLNKFVDAYIINRVVVK